MALGLIAGLGGPAPAALDRLLDAARAADLTYDHVGSTLAAGGARQRRRHTAPLGAGGEVFEAGAEALRRWAAHHGVGAGIHPEATPLRTGETLLVVLRLGPAWLVAPNRIVQTVEEEHRFGFAYGSLPGHPERGEESFTIERDEAGGVVAAVTLDAVPGTGLTTALLPVTLVGQRLAVRGYLRALRVATTQPPRSS